jgi:hypothetical protein
MRFNGTSQKIAIINGVFVTLLCAYVFWLIAIDGEYYKPVIQYWEGCFTPSKEALSPGDSIILRVVATKNRTLVGEVSWTLVNAHTRQVVAFFLTRPTVMRKGYNDANVNVGIVPTYIEEGYYFMNGMVTYSVNPLKEVAYQLESAPFYIRSTKGS